MRITLFCCAAFFSLMASSLARAQSAPQTAPQAAPQAAPQSTPQSAPQSAPQSTPQAAPQSAPQAAPTAAQADHDRRMGWFRDARFGMFIHWGLYAVPAGQWDGKPVGSAGEWILNTAKIQPTEYMKLQTQFNPINFNADEWVRIAKLAGQKYIVITSKHHDGFALWDSKVSSFDVMGTPFKRDILLELARACERGGIQLCFYHSIMDWTHDDYIPHRAWDPRGDESADFDRYVGYMKQQLKELVGGKYGKIGILWFDGEWEDSWTHRHGLDLAKYVRSLDPDIIINNRVDKGRAGMAGMTSAGDWAGDYGTPEQEIPSTGIAGADWETCMTMNDTWGFKSDDHNWKSSDEMIRMLCDIASKGGNFLLNVGPQADGRIPGESIERLMRIGAWMETNGDAIYGSSASPFVRLPWGRCTRKSLPDGSTRLYFHVFDWPQSADAKGNSLFIPGLNNEIRSVRLLGDTAFVSKPTRQAEGWSITLPVVAPDQVSSVIAVDIVGAPNIAAFVSAPDAAGVFHLMAKDADLHGKIVYENNSNSLGYWLNMTGNARWTVRFPSSAKYRVTAEVAAAPNQGGSRYQVAVGSSTVEAVVGARANWHDFQTVDLGILDCAAGNGEVVVNPLSIAKTALMNLRSITLTPIAK